MQIGQYGATSYHVEGGKIERTGDFYVRLSSQQSDAKNPNELRKMAEFTLSDSELDQLIGGLVEIRKGR